MFSDAWFFVVYTRNLSEDDSTLSEAKVTHRHTEIGNEDILLCKCVALLNKGYNALCENYANNIGGVMGTELRK